MGTFDIVSTSVVKGYKTIGDGFVANGSYTECKGVLMKLDGTVYEDDFMKTYVGSFGGERKDGSMQYKTIGDKAKVESAIAVIESYINNQQ